VELELCARLTQLWGLVKVDLELGLMLPWRKHALASQI